MYFAWLGFYTKMLILPAVIGLIVFIAGLASIENQTMVKHLCNEQRHINTTICRMCPDLSCPFGNVREVIIMLYDEIYMYSNAVWHE